MASPARNAAARTYGPVYSFRTARLFARCWNPEDAPALRAALDANDQHLRPYIPWMRDEPMALEGTLEKLRRARAAFDTNADFRYGLFLPEDGRVVGEAALLGRAGAGALEVGYWIDRELTGRGLASEAAGAVVRIAFEVQGVQRVELHHSFENAPSAGVPRRLGFRLDGTFRRRAHDSDGVTRDLTTWSMFADEYPASAARRTALEARDCLGTVFPFADAEQPG